MIDKKISNEFQNNGVVLLKKIIDQKWIEELRKGIEYNFQNPSKYNCFEHFVRGLTNPQKL